MRAILLALLLLTPAAVQAQPPAITNQPLGGVTPPIFGAPTINGGSWSPSSMSFPASTCAAPAINEQGATTTGIAFTATPSILDCVNGTTVVTTTASAVTLGSSVSLALGDSTSLSQGAANRIDIASGDSLRLVSGELQLTSGSRVFLNGSVLTIDNGGGGSINSQFTGTIAPTVAYGLGGSFTLIASATAPTVTSAGTSPSVPNANGTVAFRVNVGTGGTATTIVLALPTAANGWNCDGENITATAANRANQRVVQQSSTTTAATLQNQTVSTGAALAFTASDIVRVICFAY